MTNAPQSPRTLARLLARKQRKHERLLARVEKAVSRAERRKSKLIALESRIAELERRVAEPRREAALNGPLAGRSRKAQLIFNPASGTDEKNNASRLAHTVSALRAHGVEPKIGVKTSGRSARRLAREAVRAGLPLVVVAAGDGTIEDVASQLVGTSTVLGIVPFGTMNNLARSLGIPLDIDEACALIGMATVRHVDVGRVFSNDKPQIEYFLESAGMGLSALAMLAGQNLEKKRWGILPHVVKRVFEAKSGTVRIELDDQELEVNSSIVTVSNTPLMGNNLFVAPDAKMDDGLLDVTVYDGMGDAALVKHFMGASNPDSERLPTYRSRHVRITSSEAMPVNSDKDVTSHTHVIDISVSPGALAVIAGNGVALSVPMQASPTALKPAEAEVADAKAADAAEAVSEIAGA